MTRAITAAAVDEAEQIGRVALLELVDNGLDADEALELFAGLADVALQLRLLLPPPFGELAELGDGPAILALLRALHGALERDPSKLEARAERAAARGNFLIAARRRARADKIRARNASEAL